MRVGSGGAARETPRSWLHNTEFGVKTSVIKTVLTYWGRQLLHHWILTKLHQKREVLRADAGRGAPSRSREEPTRAWRRPTCTRLSRKTIQQS